MSLASAFTDFPQEIATVGRIVLVAAELEYQYCSMAGNAVDDWIPVLKALYRLRATSSRIDVAKTLMVDRYKSVGLLKSFQECTDVLAFCIKLRNTYAHCQWSCDPKAGLFYGDLEGAADKGTTFEYDWKHVDLSLLQSQEAYCRHALELLAYLKEEFVIRHLSIGSHASPKPEALPQPRRHSLKSQHVPPWLSESHRERHIRRSQESEQAGRLLPKMRPPPKLSAKQRRLEKMKKPS